MSISQTPIGIFDSGLGGLTVLRQVQRLLPSERILYYADTANVPYGDKPLQVVRDLALRLTERLIAHGAKLVVMASGTSTAAGLDPARAVFPATPILGTIAAGARAAVAHPGPIGVLATAATARSRAFTEAIHGLDPSRIVHEVGCPRFVPLVEGGRAGTAAALAAAQEYLQPLLESGVCSIILGCTHFPFLLPALVTALAGHPVPPILIDPAEETIREASALLADRDLLALPGPVAPVEFAATGDPAAFHCSAMRLLDQPIAGVQSLPL